MNLSDILLNRYRFSPEMPINIARGGSDPVLDRIIDVLKAYEADHPNSRIDLYRQNSVSVRIRIVDPDFRDVDRIDRNKLGWQYLRPLDEEDQSDISMLTLLLTEEMSKSFANMEFEDPVPSEL